MENNEDDSEILARGDRTGVTVHAGFPNPAADLNGAPALSLDRLLIKHPSGTYLFRVRGDDWKGEGIFDGDIAIVDRTLSPRSQDLIISWPEDTFTLSRFGVHEHPEVWGTVSHIIHEYR